MADVSLTARRLAGGAVAAVSGASPEAQAVVVLLFAVPQLYLLPEGTSDVAVTTLVTLLLVPGLLLAWWRGQDRAVLRIGLVYVLVALLAVRVLALVWSPDPRAGLQPVTLLVQFIITLAVMSRVVRRDPGALRRLQLLYWPWVILEAGMVILFRLSPGVEDAFLRSVGGLFAGQNTIAALFGDSPNNVVDVAKSGGVFVNANVAAMFLGVNGLAALALSTVTRSRWVAGVGVAALATVPFTGSKSATILAFALPAMAFGLFQLHRSATPALRRYVLIASLSVGALAILLLLVVSAGLREALVDAFVGRTVIWRFGAESFQDDPILGLGYGGWDAGFGPYAAAEGLYRSFPPHNVLLAAWSSTGIAGLALTLAFFALALWLVVRGLSDRTRVNKGFVAFAGAAIGWILIQGMGENTDLFGEIHLVPVVSLLIAGLIWPAGEESKDSDTSPRRRHRETPAVSAVGDLHREPGAGAAELPAVVRGEGRGPDHAGSRLG